ncbi:MULTISPECIES: hypothetical protein [Paenibacillus]|nr:hypothetical protein [Paenibacillus caseinilyticus]MCZ8522132.1 hypothetical protein [Paenibacillus caseinilyticus]
MSLSAGAEEQDYTVELESVDDAAQGAAEDETADPVHVEWAGYI